jgi:hypothetical protein
MRTLVWVLTAGKQWAEYANCKHLPKVYFTEQVGVV